MASVDVAEDVVQFSCPKCSVVLAPPTDREAECMECGWQGQVALFRPLTLQAQAAELAMPDDAVCTHHPEKRAVAICEGTGDYICSLCCVDFEGHTLSVQYLESAGKAQAQKLFNPYLNRPDSAAILFVALCFVPYINACWILGAPIWIVVGLVNVFQAQRLRQTDPLFARLVTPSRLVIIGTLLVLIGLLGVTGVALFVIGLTGLRN